MRFAASESTEIGVSALQFVSAGTHVHNFLANDVSSSIQLKMIADGLRNRVVRASLMHDARRMIAYLDVDSSEWNWSQRERDDLHNLFREIRPLVQAVHIALRNEALHQASIPNALIPSPLNPFAPQEHYDLVLPMHADDRRRVGNRYGNKHTGERALTSVLAARNATVETVGNAVVVVPPIMTYGQLVEADDLVDRPDGGLARAKQIVEYFLDTRQFALTRICELLDQPI